MRADSYHSILKKQVSSSITLDTNLDSIWLLSHELSYLISNTPTSPEGRQDVHNMQLYVLLALCGVALAKETFIVGGRNVTEPGKWPWMVRLKTVISIDIHCKVSAVRPLYYFLTKN